MKEVERISLGGYAFTFEDDAARLAEEYLGELEKYYDGRAGGGEILDGIEERMAELITEKAGREGVVSRPMIEEAIGILGRPEDIEAAEEESGTETGSPVKPAAEERKQRKLYRDLENKMVAGVCSGLAAYFKCDVVLIRIIFIGLTVLTCVVGCHIGDHNSWTINLPMPVLYFILWIAMPEAKTVQQRWQMGVSNPPAASTATRRAEPIGSGLGRVLRVVIGILLLMTAICGLTFGVASLLGHSVFGWNFLWDGDGVFRGSVTDAIREHAPGLLPMVSSVFYQIAVLLTCFLPFVGMLYGGIMMIFDLRSPSWRPGLVIFILWIIALTVFTVLTLMGLFHAGLLD